MRLIRHQNVKQPVAATIGNFDGLHLGHQAIIKQLTQFATENNMASMLMSFEPMPQEYFMAQQAPARLMNFRERVTFLKKSSLDYFAVLPFNHALASLSAEQFITEILLKKLNIHYLLVGDDFRFGKNRTGDVNLLKQYQNKNFTVDVMPTQQIDAARISSTRVRAALAVSDFTEVAHLLGRPYTMMGKVIQGQQRGRTIGFPTANIDIKRQNPPVRGVFAVKAHGLPNGPITGVANLGVRPTVDGTRCWLEVHLFDFSDDIYNKHLKIEFCHKIRDEKKFDSFDLLKQQIADDVLVAKRYFS